MKILTRSECELVSGSFRIQPRAAVDCVPFEDVPGTGAPPGGVPARGGGHTTGD
jgi:hypothetical protein